MKLAMARVMTLRLLGAAFAGLVTFNSANAVVYEINDVLTTGGPGTVLGTLTTNGFIGPLTDPTDVVDWNLAVTANSFTKNLFGPLSGDNSTILIGGSGLVVSATDLTFQFNSPDALVFRIASNDGTVWQLTALGPCCLFGREDIEVTIDGNPQLGARFVDGAPVIGEATPLPGALPLFATGLGALGLFSWRRKGKAAA